jgi:hypothetical protein
MGRKGGREGRKEGRKLVKRPNEEKVQKYRVLGKETDCPCGLPEPLSCSSRGLTSLLAH